MKNKKCILVCRSHGLAILATAMLLPLSNTDAVQATPDLVPIADSSRSYVYGSYLDQTQQPGRVLMRLSTAMGNRGTGPLEIFGGAVSGSVQEVYQRVYDSNGTYQDRLAGNFIYHPTHGHLHLEGFATYNLRMITAGGGVGGIIAAGAKTSFCLINITQYWPSITSAALVRNGRGGSNCGQVQGISAGYADVYDAGLTDQWIDVTNVPSGSYWLEVIADPDNHIQESDETNNIVRIQVNYTNPIPPPTNNPPVVTNPGTQISTRGAAVSLQVSANDPDGNPLTFTASGLPFGLNIDANTGRISGTVSSSAVASYTTTVIASDGRLQGSTTFTWNTTAPLNGMGLRAQYYTGTSLSSLIFTRTDALLDFSWGTGSPDARLPADGFSTRWSGKVIPPSTGSHTFTARADDGVRVWVNGQLIINQWVAGALAEYSGVASLTEGQETDITVEYFEGTGSAEFHLFWSGPGYSRQLIPTNRMIPAIGNEAPMIFNPGPQTGVVATIASLPVNATDPNGDTIVYSAAGLPNGLAINSATGVITGTYAATGTFNCVVTARDASLNSSAGFTWVVTAAEVGTGLHAGYFNDRTLTTEIVHREDALVDFNWDTAAPASGVNADNFSVRWNGELLPQFSQTYTFKVVCDGGAKLWVNNMPVFFAWEPTGSVITLTGTATLVAGQRTPLRLEYNDTTGAASVRLLWSSSSQAEQVIPTARLFPTEYQPPADTTPPLVTLSTPATTVTGSFPANVVFSESVLDLTASDFVISNGTATLTSTTNTHSLSVTPSAEGVVTVALPAGRAFDAAGNGNTASNTLNVSYTPTTNLLAGRDIGTVGVAGSTVLANGVYTIKGSGSDIYYTADSFQFASTSITGDGEIKARVTSQTNTSAWAKAGVMIREDLTAGSRHATMYVTPYETRNGFEMLKRTTTGGATTDISGPANNAPPDNWVSLVRTGNTITGYASANGTTWTQVHAATYTTLPTTLYFGLAVTSVNNSVLGTATFDNVQISGTNQPPTVPAAPAGLAATAQSSASILLTWTDVATNETSYRIERATGAGSYAVVATLAAGSVSFTDPGLTASTLYSYKVSAINTAGNGTAGPVSATTLATGGGTTLAGADIGTVGVAGSTVLANGVYTIKGSGSDIYYTADSFQFASTSITGDGEIKARVTSQTNTAAWAKAGVMMREDLTAGSRHATIYVTPYETRNGFEMLKRTATGGATTDISGPANNAPPDNWVRLVRSGNTIIGYASANGTTWTQVHAATYTTLPTTLYFGLAVTSANNTVLGTATFDNVQIIGTNQPPTVPAAPTGLGATAQSSASILLTWTDVATNETGYRIERATGTGAYAVIATLAAGSVSFADSGLTAFTLYSYKVSAMNTAGAGTAGPVSATTLATSGGTMLAGADIGTVGVAGSTVLANGVYTVKGSGSDIYYTADSFHYASTSITGDGEIKARVTSQTNTAAWAKAGVMIRESRAVGSRHATMYITPYETRNGFEYLSRSATNGPTVDAGGPANNAPPDNWVRLVRAGNTITGYASANGTTWTLVKTVTFTSLPANLMFGLAVTSVNNTVPGTATFDNVQVSGTPGAALASSVTRTLASPVTTTVPDLMSTQSVSGVPGVAFTRELGSAARYELHLLDDLARSPAGWRVSGIAPGVVSNGDGTEMVSYPDIAAQFAGAEQGFARLHVELDTTGDGFADIEKNGEVFGFMRRACPVGTATAGNPFATPALGAGVIAAIGDGIITLDRAIPSFGGASCYLEVTRGANEGQRIEIDEAASSGGTLVIEAGAARSTVSSLPATLVGDSFAIRAHQTVSGMFPENLFTGSSRSGTADRVLFYTGTAFEALWLWKRPDGYQQWVREGDAALANAGSRVIDVTEGILVQVRGSAVTLTLSGIARANAVAMPVKAGTRLVANIWPSAISPNALGMTIANGFTGARSSSSADQMQFWLGDVNAGSSGYASHFLLVTGPLQQWTATGDAALTNENDAPLFGLGRAFFVKAVSGKPALVLPLAWKP